MTRLARFTTLLPLLTLLAIVAAVPAQADCLITPFVGVDFSGDVGAGSRDGKDTALTYGGSFGFMAWKAFGLEADFGYTPDVLGDENDTGKNSVTTFMANVIVGGQASGVRPYFSGGLGLIRLHLEDPGHLFADISDNDFGIDLGGGLMGFFSHHVGVRGDIRYFRSLQRDRSDDDLDFDLGHFDFWRGTGGLVFRF